MLHHLLACVDEAVSADAGALCVRELQDEAVSLRTAAGRLLGRADQVLATLDSWSGGRVLERPARDPELPSDPVVSDPQPAMPLLMSVQSWWRETTRVAGTQAGRDLRRATTLSCFPAWGQAVVAGVLTPEQAQALCRLDGQLPDT